MNLAILCVFVAGMVFSTARLDRTLESPAVKDYYGQLAEERRDVLVLFGTFFNMRRVTADVYWIKLLMYLGDNSFVNDRWPDVLPISRTGTFLNPRFVAFYEYSSAVLAWQLEDRWREALELLEKGQRYNPGSKRLILYAAAISYQHAGQTGKTAEMLERLLFSGEYPPLLPRILANIYKARGDYEDSLRIWYFYISTGVRGAGLEYAKEQVADVRRLMGSEKAGN